MPGENGESFELDLDRVESYLSQTPAVIERGRARTANLVALLLITGLLISLPLYMAAILVNPDASQVLASVFDKWYAIVSPLAGAAIGAYYATRAEPEQKRRRR
ncbi:MAG: hypothetical protein L0Y72_29690 [Gemmataceae bacterium]|nr:hypothetical protein [Gemmataceae bacterium]